MNMCLSALGNRCSDLLRFSICVLLLLVLWQRAEAAPVLKPALKLEVAASGFDKALDGAFLPGSSSELFILESGGKIVHLKLAPDAELNTVAELGSVEQADRVFLGLALHPKFLENKQCYVSYTLKGRYGTAFRVAEYLLSGAADKVFSTERVILEEIQPYSDARGGGLVFDRAGMLFVTLGDGGGKFDSKGHAQSTKTLLGAILRLNLEEAEGTATFVPPIDNPFVMNDAGRREIWAYGFRDPRKISIDQQTGEVWVGDRGEDSFEEVDLVLPARNYGWSVYEGPQCLRMRFECLDSSFIPPVWSYKRNQGSAVVGGHVYRGVEVPEMEGVYVFGDFESGRIWGLPPTTAPGARKAVELLDTAYKISGFIQDAGGELYLLSFSTGELLKFSSAVSRVKKAGAQ